MKPERFFQIALAVIALGALALQAVAVGPARGSLWGFHLPAFLPVPFVVLAWLVWLSTAVWLLGRRFGRAKAPNPRPVGRAGSWVVALGFAALAGEIFWLLRSRQTVLGDAWPLINDLPRGLAFHVRQPLGMAFQQAVYRLTGHFFGAPRADSISVAAHTVALANVFVGITFVLVAWRLGVAIFGARGAGTERGAGGGAGLAAAVLVLQGYALLFFGYLELYALPALLVALFLLAGVQHLRGRWPLVVPALLLLAAVGVHMSSVLLAPALAALAARGLARRGERTRTVRDLGIFVLACVALDRVLAVMSPGYSLWQGIAGILRTGTSDQGSGAGIGYLLSVRHLRDFCNEQFLLGPLAAYLFVPALVFGARRGVLRDAISGFLVLVATLALGASWLTSDPALGYARDWDLFAPVAVGYTAAWLAVLARLVPDRVPRTQVLAAALAISAPHFVAWVWINASESRSMARFATLPLGQGRMEVSLGNWHYRNGRTSEAVTWFRQALRAEPRNSNAWAFLGQILAEQGSMEGAAEAFGRACMLRPDKLLYRHNYVKALTTLGRHADALPHLEMICNTEPDLVENWLEHAAALRALGREAQAHAVLANALPPFESARARAPEDFAANLAVGALLAALDRPDEALAVFLEALRLDSRSDAALYNTGGLLVHMGRSSDARPYLERLLQLYPQHQRRDEVLGWLAATPPR